MLSLGAEISVEVTIRAVEVLHSVFIRGSLGLPEHLSFLLTLLSGHISAQGLSSLAASSTKLCSEATICFAQLSFFLYFSLTHDPATYPGSQDHLAV
jgi:hypothetical protein